MWHDDIILSLTILPPPFPLTTNFMQMTLSYSSLSTHSTLTQAFLTFKTVFNRSLPGWLLIFILWSPLRLKSCSSDSKTNLPKYTTLHLILIPLCSNSWLHLWQTSYFLWPNYISPKACYYHIRQLRCIQHYPDYSTACTIATSIVHSELDYCNSLYYKLLKSQLSHLQQIQNSLARTVVKAHKSCHITPIRCTLYWPRITESIKFKLLSHIYNVFTTTQPPYLQNLISVQRPRSSPIITLARPPSSSSLTNPTPTPVVSLLPPGLPLRTIAWTVSSELPGLFFPYCFVPVPRARLSCQLSSAR